jgi:heme-degrading monooxygenase HmoA
MFIAVNKIGGPAGHGRDPQMMVAGFQRAMAGMKQFQGFLGLEIWTAEDGSMQAVSRWTSKEALDEYLNSSLFGQHHSGPPAAAGEGQHQAHGSHEQQAQGGPGQAAPAPAQPTYYTAQVLS